MGIGYSGLFLLLVKTLGYAGANAYGSIALWSFVLLLALRWIWLRLRAPRPDSPALGKRRNEPAPAAKA